jgi:hypothetical protein
MTRALSSSPEETGNHEEQCRPDRGNKQTAEEPGCPSDPERGEEQSTDNSSRKPDSCISQAAESSAGGQGRRNPAGKEADDNPGDQASGIQVQIALSNLIANSLFNSVPSLWLSNLFAILGR